MSPACWKQQIDEVRPYDVAELWESCSSRRQSPLVRTCRRRELIPRWSRKVADPHASACATTHARPSLRIGMLRIGRRLLRRRLRVVLEGRRVELGRRHVRGVLEVGVASAEATRQGVGERRHWPQAAVLAAAALADARQVAVGARRHHLTGGVAVPQQLELMRQMLDGGGALVAVHVPLRLLREPALRILRVDRHHVSPVSSELGAVPRSVQPGEDLVVSRPLVARVLDDGIALDEMEGKPIGKQRHAAVGARVQRLHQVGRHHRDADHREANQHLRHPRARESPAVMAGVAQPSAAACGGVLHAEGAWHMLELLSNQRERHVRHHLQLPRDLDVERRL
mmetsp:Transcript_45941/g.113993  ORF Transcript_45941/g.113993 Transcript_45941/m.113993 type:complete len:340 (-) Transcript_45941:250-1269(-)